ncbi:DUF6263 family protein [Sediminibacter sp. Hel_I_10]|uniref:DUF6263 family protein n=1 Tax=Sediminibacter sp. Hel_I_10 TaxID=1392490 RepID=UPI00047937EB|nr:DUF6263 family protein [Sediminibacter sp. Hel_I_10]
MKPVAFFLLIFGLCATAFAQKSYDLGYKVQKGDAFKVYQSADQEIIQDMNGEKHEMSNMIEGEYTFRVASVNDSIIIFNFKFDRFKMKSTSSLMGELMNVDTKDSINADDVEAKLFSGITAASLKMKMYKNGHIKSISGTEQLIEGMVNNAGDFNAFTKELMKESMKKEFGGATLSESFEQLTYVYPKVSVKKGDTWRNNFKGDLSSSNVWTLENVSEAVFMISGKSDVSFKIEDDTIMMDLSGTMTSKVNTSRISGFISSVSSTSTATGTSVMKSMKGVLIPTTVTTKITYKVKNYVQ